MKLGEEQIKKIILTIDKNLEHLIDKIYQSDDEEYIVTFSTENHEIRALNNYSIKIKISQLLNRY